MASQWRSARQFSGPQVMKDIWREAWINSEFTGQVALSRRASGEEFLEIRCPEVLERYGSQPEILDDGRSVHLSVNDVVAFGVLEESGSLIAVNVWRISIPRKFTEEEVMDEDSSEGSADPVRRPAQDATKQPKQPQLATVQADLELKDASPPKPKTVAFGRQDAVKRSLEAAQLHPAAKAKAAMQKTTEEVQTKDPPTLQSFQIQEALPTKRSRELGKTLLHPTAKAKAPGMPKSALRSTVTIDVQTVEDVPAKKPKTETVPEILKPTAKAKAGVRMLGTVNRQINGRFSIFCEEISGLHGDAEIPPEHVPMNLKVGDRVSFVVRELEGQQSSPIWAKNLQVLSSAPLRAPALRAPALRAPALTAKPAMADGKAVVDLTEEDFVEVIGEAKATAKANGGSSPQRNEAVEEAAAVKAKHGSSAPEKEAPMEAKAAAVKAKGGSSAPEKEAPMEEAAAVKAKGGSSAPEKEAPMEEGIPRTPEEWAAAQSKFFPGSPPLRPNWIRIRSKSTGEVYFYNMVSGVSTDEEPRLV